MPELPDLEVFSSNLDKKLARKTIDHISITNTKNIIANAATFKKSFEQQKLYKVYREGKELRFEFKNGHILGMHLMLHGKLFLFKDDNEEKHTLAELHFTDGTGLALTDFQKIAALTVNPAKSEAPDAMSDDLNAAYLDEKLSATRATIKNVLLDQHIIRGIGNAYADEILWDARISPFSISNKIPIAKTKKLARSIYSVLSDAIVKIQKKNPDIIAGEIRDFMLIHNSALEKSPTGAEIKKHTAGGRNTYFTDEQELFE
ncbi:formamidopyrimidine-DNA glycosylase [Chitinophaga sp. CF118]|uniref:Fpg/Nei family DNA glycosylase n=1 Tax=Chitinophaga sp. CF118 TaxID=1884367 RepID=UPI0008E7CB87|nr:DNA-formamidopyrimidine glycosylase family protein [Chitinophaga sp. CF118]SFD75316.1 formamidopyrimidine-DNA glycosylase [Chitinophaga sp. CF118]